MAELTAARWQTRQTAAQFRAIAWLRWRILANSTRRKGGTGEMVGRILTYPIFVFLGLIPILGAGGLAFYFAFKAQLAHISWLLWATFILAQLLNINLGRAGTTFDPNELIRFPLRLRTFIAVRLLFGTLSPSNVLATLMSLAIAVGIGIAIPALTIYALLALAIFAAANVLFTRMVFAWVDRWLSTRRAREIFTFFIVLFSVGVQWANFSFNPAYHHHRHVVTAHQVSGAMLLYHRAHPFLSWLPPELTGSAIAAANAGKPLAYGIGVLGTALFAAAFLAIFSSRMRTEFRGEVFTDAANAVASAPRPAPHLAPAPSAAASTQSNRTQSVIPALLHKELLYVRRNTGLFYSLVVPVIMVFLIADRLSLRSNTEWLLPSAVAYTLIGVMPISYNSFGLEAAGAQLYFMIPVRLRSVFVAKNLLNALLVLIEMVVVFGVVVYLAGVPPLWLMAVSVLWVIATFLVNLTIGNLRSVSAPKRIEAIRAAGKQVSPLSALLSMGVLLFFAALGAGLLLLARVLHEHWFLLPTFAVLDLAALGCYLLGLRHIGAYTMRHRELLFEVLSRGA